MKMCDKCGSHIFGKSFTFTEDGKKSVYCILCKMDRRKEKLISNQKLRAGFSKIRNDLVALRGEICELCKTAGEVEAHHIVKLANGGTNDPSNLILLCHDCHRGVAHKNGTRN